MPATSCTRLVLNGEVAAPDHSPLDLSRGLWPDTHDLLRTSSQECLQQVVRVGEDVTRMLRGNCFRGI